MDLLEELNKLKQEQKEKFGDSWQDNENRNESSDVLKIKNVRNLWQSSMEYLKSQMNCVTFDLWMKDLQFVDFKEKLIICANTQTAKRHILTTYNTLFQNALDNTFGFHVEFVVYDPEEKQDYFMSNQVAKQKDERRRWDKYNKPNFNPLYTFDSFVVGNSNNIVYHACKAVAENPGKNLNPLFIYGGVGLGKTHLLHAIGNYVLKTFPEKKVCFNTCEQFTNEYIDSLRADNDHSTLDFRTKYRSVDVLIIDDIQFISNKTSTQEEFFHTFNDLYQMGKQIILSSDRPPKEIATLQERLTSRFASGFIHEIIPPDFETRVAIFKKKTESSNYQMDDDVAYFLAEHTNSNIREMEGVLSKIFFLASLTGSSKATMKEALEAVSNEEKEFSQGLDADKIIENVCKYFNISKNEITGKKKSKEIVVPRMIAIYLITDLLDLPLMSIGSKLGGRDHTTIMHARDKVSSELNSGNAKIKLAVKDIKMMCKV